MADIGGGPRQGLIESIGRRVVEAACIQLRAWSVKPDTALLTLAINISAREFCHPEFATRLLGVVVRGGVDPRKLLLEFTERAMFGTMEETHTK
ncbi:EAL domain-containing protein [Tunturibacter empetritectus]|uniref:EAL domain-containing protein (Putative c-di-GMP-specific phosphodiesterase class I) n=1 Tax=Tunturiibacter lichenicola TaxID=2051959 RepID=A0A7W8J639_9BACT|nr:EAL domain-containing protein [Edaphobacter lichenicola]MBB5343329.1 EAL domain-containing protein (putative c-di-GMP-specific phosphodiesterase class I) [Edaphobacter lichenicola]